MKISYHQFLFEGETKGVVNRLREYFDKQNDPAIETEDHFSREAQGEGGSRDFETHMVGTDMTHEDAVSWFTNHLQNHGAKDLEVVDASPYFGHGAWGNPKAGKIIRFKDNGFDAIATVKTHATGHNFTAVSDRTDRVDEAWTAGSELNPEKKRFHQGLNQYITPQQRAALAAAASKGAGRSPTAEELEHVAQTEHGKSFNVMPSDEKRKVYNRVLMRVTRTGKASSIPMQLNKQEQSKDTE